MSSTDDSSATVQREAERERASLVTTLDMLRENLRPANVIDEVMSNAKISTSDISDKVWSTARANPIPAVLIGLGAAMLLGVGSKVVVSKSAKEPVWPDSESDVQPISGRNSSIRGRRGPRPIGVTARVQQDLDSEEARISDSVADLNRNVRGQRRKAGRRSANPSSEVNPGLGAVSNEDTMTKYSRPRRDLMSSLSNILDEQPLVLAALGVAVGAAIGAAIPGTEVETRLMGDASGSVKQSAQDLAQQQYQQLKATAGETLEGIKRTAVEHGVSKENLMGLVQDVGGKVRDAATDAVSSAAEKATGKAS